MDKLTRRTFEAIIKELNGGEYSTAGGPAPMNLGRWGERCRRSSTASRALQGAFGVPPSGGGLQGKVGTTGAWCRSSACLSAGEGPADFPEPPRPPPTATTRIHPPTTNSVPLGSTRKMGIFKLVSGCIGRRAFGVPPSGGGLQGKVGMAGSWCRSSACPSAG